MLASNWNRPDDAPELQRLSDALADGNIIDWDAVLETPPGRTRELQNLRRLDSLRQAFSETRTDHSPAFTPRGQAEMPARWGHLVIRKCLGVGAFAEVYLAYDPQLDTHFALKLLKRERIEVERERFLWEARRLAQVRHPNVVTVHGYDEHDGRPGLWMDFLHGESLETRLANKARCGWREVAVIGTEMCQALAAIHGAGIAHGDLKAANVVLNDGTHVLTDFGAAGPCGPAALLQSGGCGTPLTMAPELYRSPGPPTPAGDIYSLGVLLYRLVSGHYPVEADSDSELMRKHERREHVPLRDRCAELPAPFVQTLEQALAYDPKQRFASAGRMEAALHALLKPAPLWRRFLHRLAVLLTPRRRWAALAVASAVVAFLIYHSVIPLQFHAALFKLESGVRRPLAAGAHLRPGDQLCMEFESSRDAYVYVVNEAASTPGELNTLFPLPGATLVNPLRGGVKHLLPGHAGGAEIQWPLDDTGGRERILVIASREPLLQLEDAEVTRGIHSVVPASGINDIVRQLGPPRRDLRWELVELECDVHREQPPLPENP